MITCMVGLIFHGPERVHFVRYATTHSCHERRTITAMIYRVHSAILCIGIQYCTMPITMFRFIVLSSHIAMYCIYSTDICVHVIHHWVIRCFHLDTDQSVVQYCESVTWHSRSLLAALSVVEDCCPLWRIWVSCFGLYSVIRGPYPFVRTQVRSWESGHVILHLGPLLEHKSPVPMPSQFLGVKVDFQSVVCRALFISCGNQTLTSIGMPQLGTVQDAYCGIFILCSRSCIFMSWLHHKTP